MKLSNLRNMFVERFSSTQDRIIVGTLLGVVAIIVCLGFASTGTTISMFPETQEVKEAPVPVVEKVIPHDSIARVIVAQTDGVLVVGGGVLVGNTLVTSEMLFTNPFKSILVVIDGQEITAELLTKRDGLAALQVGLDNGIEISGGGLEIGAGGVTAVLGRHYSVTAVAQVLNDDNWVIVDGEIPITCTGDPVERGGKLVGIIVGINKANKAQAIMMDATGIVEFLAGPMEMPKKVVKTPVYNNDYNDYNDYYDNEPQGLFQRLFGGL